MNNMNLQEEYEQEIQAATSDLISGIAGFGCREWQNHSIQN
jgi:hypothetical protein